MKEESEAERKRREEFVAWVRSPMPNRSDEEFFLLRQMGPDGKRKVRGKKPQQQQ